MKMSNFALSVQNRLTFLEENITVESAAQFSVIHAVNFYCCLLPVSGCYHMINSFNSILMILQGNLQIQVM